MSALKKRHIRLALDWRNFYTSLIDRLTSEVPRIPRGNPVDVEVCFFDGTPSSENLIADLDAFVSVTLEIHSNRAASSGALASVTVMNAAMDETTDYAGWVAETDQHAVFTLSDTNFDLTGQTNGERQLWLVISSTMTDGVNNYELTWGGCNLTIWEDSAQLGLPVLGTINPNWTVGTNGNLYIKNITTGKWVRVWCESSGSDTTLAFGEDETA